eukprot:14174713-Alexandrium_andersonii.AAC.1
MDPSRACAQSGSVVSRCVSAEGEKAHLIISYAVRMCRRSCSSRSVVVMRLRNAFKGSDRGNRERSSSRRPGLSDLEWANL